MRYRVYLEQDEDGVFVATCPALPGCISQGQSRAEATESIREAIMPAHADPAEHVDFEEAAPIVVRNFLKRLGLKDAEIVHQDIDREEWLDHGARAKPGRLAGAAPAGFIA